MYSELDNLLSKEVTIDSWYDDGFLIAQDIMNKFSNADWIKLSEEVLNKDLKWQKKLVYCLDNQLIEEELEIISKMLCVKDDELLEMCIDVLRAFDNELGHSYIKMHPEIISEAKKRMSAVDSVTKMMLKSFLMKFSEC